MSLNKPVAIIGAGPVGLAALAHCITNDIDAQLYEAHKNIAPAMAEWGSVHMFSPSSWNIYPEAVSLLKEAQWSPDQLPFYVTGQELIESYLKPLSELPMIKPNISLEYKLVQVEEASSGQFTLSFDNGETALSDYVIDASGTWFNPKKISVFDESVNPYITYKIPTDANKKDFCEQSVAVVGMGDSAISSILELNAMGCVDIHWLITGESIETLLENKKAVKGVMQSNAEKIESLNQTNALTIHPYFRVKSVCCKTQDKIVIESEANERLEMDDIVANMGFEPNVSMYEKLPLILDEEYKSPPGVAKRLASVKRDKTVSVNQLKRYNIEYTLDDLTLNVPNLFIVGIKSYGARSGFLLKNGYNQVSLLIEYLYGQIHHS